MSLYDVKENVFNYLVKRNKNLAKEYIAFRKNSDNSRFSAWMMIIKLNIKYAFKKKDKNIPKPKSSVKSNVRLPYLEGAESTILNRPTEYHFAKSLLTYDVISFDIFDTLILRPFARPQDLFLIVGEKLDCMDFLKIRTEAEKEAKENVFVKTGGREVTIFDIYRIIERETGLDCETSAMIEFEVEMQYCFANPYMKRVFDLVYEQDKRIILASDMYLPQEYMEKLLTKCGYTGYEKLFVSCDYACNKSTGGLYANILRYLDNNKNIVHIGDNHKSDIVKAKEYGFDAKYYKNVHTVGNQYRADGMSTLIGSAYAGIVNTHLHNGTKQFSPYYEYGFIYGGLYVLGYCNWIYRQCKDNGITKILFLSRDGDIYKQVFDKIGLDIENEYVYWSRIANCKYASKFQRNDIVKRIVTNRIYSINSKTIGSLIEDFKLFKLIEKLDDYNLRYDTIIVEENHKIVRNLLLENWDIFEDAFKDELMVIKQYFINVIGEHKKVAIIDVGWNGSGPMGIKSLVEKEWKLDCEVFCMVACSRDANYSKLDITIAKEVVRPYIFSLTLNRGMYDSHFKSNKNTNNTYFELLTQALSPSFSGLSANSDFYFDIAEVENYSMIKDIQNGMLDFSTQYHNIFKNEYYMSNISGNDAYCSFRIIIRDLSLITNIFKNFSFSVSIVGNSKNQSTEKLNEIIKNSKL